MEVTIQYVAGCPNWRTTAGHLHDLADQGLDISISFQPIESFETAAAHGFHGSPTVLVGGVDPFADRHTPVGFACRRYATPAGPAGSPTAAQLRRAIETVIDRLPGD